MIWVVLIIILLAGIILLNTNFPFKKQTREQFLRALAKFVEGDLQAVEGQPDAYSIRFTFEGRPFVYEDVLDRGFVPPSPLTIRQGVVYKAYLKTKTAGHLTLDFTEDPRLATVVKLDVIMASQIPREPAPQDMRVRVPPKLKGLGIRTNDVPRANALLENDKIVSLFSEMKNIDGRGYPSMPLRIMDGEIILEFHSVARKNPSRIALMHHISSMEDYLERLSMLAKWLEAVLKA